MSTSLESKSILKQRSDMLRCVRNHFHQLGFVELDVKALHLYANLDAHIDVMELKDPEGYYLHTSPEYPLKKYLCQGFDKIFYLGHVFRKKEVGVRHSLEFTMLEYYTLGDDLDLFIEGCLDVVRLFFPNLSVHKMSYEEAFERYTHLKLNSPLEAFHTLLKEQNIELASDCTRQDLIQLIWAVVVEEQFKQFPCVLIEDFPEDQAALAVVEDQKAKRFELYIEGVEVANGYKELRSGSELNQRFDEVNVLRLQENLPPLPKDQELVHVMEQGLFPPCCGVAIGFDRLLWLKLKTPTLHEVLA